MSGEKQATKKKLVELEEEELKNELAKRSLDNSGTKSELTDRLKVYLTEQTLDASEFLFDVSIENSDIEKNGNEPQEDEEIKGDQDESMDTNNQEQIDEDKLLEDEPEEKVGENEDSQAQCDNDEEAIEADQREYEEDEYLNKQSIDGDNEADEKEQENEEDASSQKDADKSNLNEEKEKTKTSLRDCHLWVSRLTHGTRAATLKALFSKYGTVISTKILTSRKLAGKSHCAWITMSKPEEAEKAIKHLHQTEYDKHIIFVEKITKNLPISRNIISSIFGEDAILEKDADDQGEPKESEKGAKEPISEKPRKPGPYYHGHDGYIREKYPGKFRVPNRGDYYGRPPSHRSFYHRRGPGYIPGYAPYPPPLEHKLKKKRTELEMMELKQRSEAFNLQVQWEMIRIEREKLELEKLKRKELESLEHEKERHSTKRPYPAKDTRFWDTRKKRYPASRNGGYQPYGHEWETYEKGGAVAYEGGSNIRREVKGYDERRIAEKPRMLPPKAMAIRDDRPARVYQEKPVGYRSSNNTAYEGVGGGQRWNEDYRGGGPSKRYSGGEAGSQWSSANRGPSSYPGQQSGSYDWHMSSRGGGGGPSVGGGSSGARSTWYEGPTY